MTTLVLFGVSACGKSSVSKCLSKSLGWKFYDADDYHPASNISKMSSGIPLTDEDRQAWLATLSHLITESTRQGENNILACSALKIAYRKQLRINEAVKFVLLQIDIDEVYRRFDNADRSDHFMSKALVQSQFKSLETFEEVDWVLDATLPIETIVTLIVEKLQ